MVNRSQSGLHICLCTSCLLPLAFWTYSQWRYNSSGGAMKSYELSANQRQSTVIIPIHIRKQVTYRGYALTSLFCMTPPLAPHSLWLRVFFLKFLLFSFAFYVFGPCECRVKSTHNYVFNEGNMEFTHKHSHVPYSHMEPCIHGP